MDLPVVGFPNQRKWSTWLGSNHARLNGVWLKIGKKSSMASSVTYPESVEAALCYGWIDGQKKGWDEFFWIQRFTPRRPRSIWSRANRETAKRLMAEGRMKAAGNRAVEEAKRNGRWDAAYASQRTIAVPRDILLQLKKKRKASSFFEKLDRANRYSILFRIEQAKRPELRTQKIQRFIAMLEEGKKLHPTRS